MPKLLPVETPEIGKPVRALLKYSGQWVFNKDAVLVAVNESDVTWRFKNDGSELSYDWDVVYWEYLD